MEDPEGVIALFIPIAAIAMVVIIVWLGDRRKEKEAFHRSEVLRKIAETESGAAGKVLEMMRQEESQARIRRREGLKIGGLITLAAGLGFMAALALLVPSHRVWAVGLIPLVVGAALVAYVMFLAPSLDKEAPGV